LPGSENPGSSSGDLLPQIATQADDICMIRSMHTGAVQSSPGHGHAQQRLRAHGPADDWLWLLYDSATNAHDLPGYVVLEPALDSGGATNWSSGFLPSLYGRHTVSLEGEPVKNCRLPRIPAPFNG